MPCTSKLMLLAAGLAVSAAAAQPPRYAPRPLAPGELIPVQPADGPTLELEWHTIDSGGGRLGDAQGLTLEGTIGQFEAGAMQGAGFTLQGGFWFGIQDPVPPLPCYANCDGSTTPPVLNVADFGCFLQRFAAADPYANCDGSTQPPVLNVADFGCFLSKFAAGCQ